MRLGGLWWMVLLLTAAACSDASSTASSVLTTEGPASTETSSDGASGDSDSEGNASATDDDGAVERIAIEEGVHYLFVDGVHVGAWGPQGWIPLDDARPTPPSGVDVVGVTADVGAPLTVSSSLVGTDPCQTILDLGAGATDLDWELFPRPIATIIASDEHRSALDQVLREDGLEDPTIESREAIRVDLEGDGVDEVLLEATLGGEPFFASSAGDYSTVVLRQLGSDDTVSNLPLAVISTNQAEADEAGIDELATDLPAVPKAHHRVADVVDLNGDGTYEIVIATRADHSVHYSVFDPVAGFDTPVLESGCSW